MKKIIYTCFLIILVVFTLKNIEILNAYSYAEDVKEVENIKDYNDIHGIDVSEKFKPTEKTYRRTMIVYINGLNQWKAGVQDINYTVYKYEGIGNDYYMFFYDTLSQPQNKTFNRHGGRYFNGIARTIVVAKNGDLVRWNEDSKPQQSTSTLTVGISGKTPSISYSVNYNHSELTIKNLSNIFDKKYYMEFSYNRTWVEYLFNKVPDFLYSPHHSRGTAIYKVKKGELIKFDIEFYGRMNYSRKHYDAWHTVERKYEVLN